MAATYLWADGFDDYTLLSEFFDSVQNPDLVPITISNSYARYAPPAGCPGQGLLITGDSQVAAFKKFNAGATPSTVVIGVAMMLPNLPGGGFASFLFGSAISFLGNLIGVFGLALNGAGQLFFCADNNPGNLIGTKTPTGTIGAGQWHYYEIAITISATVGTAALYLDGSLLLNLTGLDTITGAGEPANVGYLQLGGETTVYYDDLYALGGTLSPLGSTRIITKMPAGVGDLTGWTPNGASANWQCVDEIPPDGDTTYVSASSSVTDSYVVPLAGLGSLSAFPPAFTVTRSIARFDDAGPHTLENGVRSSGANGLAAAVSLSSSYAVVDGYIVNDPATSAPWTSAGADAAQILKTRAT